MISMRFKVKTDIPVTPGATIFGGEYCLRFRREDGGTTDVKFQFQNYKCTVEGGHFINCEAYGLHTSGHVSSDDFLKLVQDCDAVWTYFDALHNLQEGDFGVMLEVSNIVISSEEKTFRLPNFVFPGVIVEMEQNQINTLTRAMREVLGFCVSHKFLSAYGENGVYFATENGVIYRTSDNNRSGVNWFAETPIDYDNTASVKKLTTIQALFRFEESASASISVVFDDGKTAVCGTISKETGVHPLYCVVPFSDHIARKIRIDAVGNVELLSIEQKFTSGGVKHGAG